MTFLNMALAFGAVAFSIPLIIHILNRSRFKTVEWGAMHLLESVIKVNHRRFHIEQIILLLVRCAIPVLLAFCLARPVLTGSNLLEGDAPVSLVVLLDTSYSMDAVGPGGSRFDEAVSAAVSIVNAVPRGSEVAVIQTGGSPTSLFDQPVYDAEAVVRRLRQLEGGFGASDMEAAVDEALAVSATMSNARREIVVVSDFQPADWENVNLDGESLQQRIGGMDIQPTLSLLKIGQPNRSNISVESLEFPNRAIGVGQQISVRANLQNHGNVDYDNARVIMRVDGAEQSVSQVALTADGSNQTLFQCTFDKAGSHVMEVEVVADDPLPTDNRYAAAVTIWDNIKVLLVDGDPKSQPLESETDFLSIALTPYTFGRVRLTDLVETQTVSGAELKEEHLKAVRVVVLANVSKLSDAQLAALSAYVQEGGALLVSAGNRIDLNWYREKMYASGAGLLPSPFGALQGRVNNTGKSSRIVAQHFDHPALEFFNEASNGDLSTAEIRQWHQITVATQMAVASSPGTDNSTTLTGETVAASDSDGITVMARLDTGEPLMVERAFGDGVVVQLATAADADWSDLPMRPIFVPFVQQLVSTMASRISPPRNIATGDPAVALIPPDDSEASDDAKPASEGDSVTVSIVTPNGSRQTLQTSPRGQMQVAQWNATQRPGIYNMSLPSTETIHFVAESSRDESNLAVLDETGITSLADSISATVVSSATDYIEQDKLRRHGREIWRYVLAALLAFMFLEVVLQQQFARVRT